MPYHRSEEHTSELQSHDNLVCRLLLEKKEGAASLELQQRPGGVSEGPGRQMPCAPAACLSLPLWRAQQPNSAGGAVVLSFFKGYGAPRTLPPSPPQLPPN